MTASGAVVTVGSFDGVHRGHQAVLALVVRLARGRGLTSALVTFEPHPLDVVNPAAAPQLLTVADEKREILAQMELDRLVVLPFTTELARLGPEEFLRDVLVRGHDLRELVIGYDHGFGRGRSGDLEVVKSLAATAGIPVHVVEAVRDGDRPISSTLVRGAVSGGDLEAANRWLGRPYALLGRVEHGAGRGRTIGVPTVNLAAPDARKLLPPDGVYAVRLYWRGGCWGGMMNQGSRPTFGVAARGLEIHLFDFSGELYGEMVQVEWVRRLRDVQAFPSRDALVEQLGRDARVARESLNL
ncbi:MAG TPA: bifunctional riboflavin kinase/FAD synthetase [Gemmatimonadales bacterium]